MLERPRRKRIGRKYIRPEISHRSLSRRSNNTQYRDRVGRYLQSAGRTTPASYLCVFLTAILSTIHMSDELHLGRGRACTQCKRRKVKCNGVSPRFLVLLAADLSVDSPSLFELSAHSKEHRSTGGEAWRSIPQRTMYL
jgi:hypothetical protein